MSDLKSTKQWKVVKDWSEDLVIEDENGSTVCDFWGSGRLQQENASLIVRAVNCHEELVNKLCFIHDNTLDGHLRDELFDLIKRAKGEL